MDPEVRELRERPAGITAISRVAFETIRTELAALRENRYFNASARFIRFCARALFSCELLNAPVLRLGDVKVAVRGRGDCMSVDKFVRRVAEIADRALNLAFHV